MSLLFSIGFLNVGLSDIIDILIVTFLLYQAYQRTVGGIALKVFLGGLLLFLTHLVVEAAGMELLAAITAQLIEVGGLLIIILFQQEIKRFLLGVFGATTLPGSKLLTHILGRRKAKKAEIDITPIVEAIQALAGSNTGALIVFFNENNFGYYQESGETINATISKRLLMAIFSKESPLHDGAVIIHNNKIVVARGILPVTDRQDVPAHLGLRHRAAVGMTEETDTLVLVVSEETGQISAAKNGKLETNISSQETRAIINEYLEKKTGT